MTWVKQAFGSSVGLKFIMALTGLALTGFVLAHMAGNLLVFLGPDALNGYAKALHDKPALLWVARLGLLAVFLLHMGTAARLSMANRTARPVAYVCPATVDASIASRTMLMTGLVVLLYLLYHLAHFTFNWVHADPLGVDAAGRPDVYRMVVTSFQSPLVSAIYVLAQIVLCVHLWHGATSFFQSLGLSHERYDRAIRCVGPTLSIVVLIGNGSMPLAALFGLLNVT